MQTEDVQTTQEVQITSIQDTLDIIPKLDPFDLNATGQVIAEMKTALEKVMDLRNRSYLFSDKVTALLAARGETDMLKFCLVELACPAHEDAYSRAAERGYLECMYLLQEHKHNPTDALYRAVAAGELAAVKSIVETNLSLKNVDKKRLRSAQEKGGFPDVLDYLKTTRLWI
nr:hypothetical protein Cbor_49 [Cedratvirus borely]